MNKELISIRKLDLNKVDLERFAKLNKAKLKVSNGIIKLDYKIKY